MLVVANWKAYVEDLTKAKKLLALSHRLARAADVDIVLAPPSPLLGVLTAGKNGHVAFAAQDISATTGGAHTGEATAQAYAAAGATYAIIGHSERRALGETDALIAEKLSHAIAQGLIPVLCIGESARDEEGHYLHFVREQLSKALDALSPNERASVVIAYEPVWAIGKTAAEAIHPSELTEMVLYIRKVLAELLPGKSSSRSLVLYGGSVEPGNARDLAGASGIDGFLVGHASVDLLAFGTLIRDLS